LCHILGLGVLRQVDSEQANFRVARHPARKHFDYPENDLQLLFGGFSARYWLVE
jgi:hypothetical protein